MQKPAFPVRSVALLSPARAHQSVERSVPGCAPENRSRLSLVREFLHTAQQNAVQLVARSTGV